MITLSIPRPLTQHKLESLPISPSDSTQPSPSMAFSQPVLYRRLTSSPLAAAAAALRRSLHEGPDTIEELLDRHVVKATRKVDAEEDEAAARRRLTSARREALGLYRDILRASRFFTWTDAHGVPWREVLRANARREFEDARFERDPEVVTRLLIGGHDAVQAALDKLADAHRKAADEKTESLLLRNGGGR